MKNSEKSTLINNSQPTNLAKRPNLTTLSLIAGMALMAFMTCVASAPCSVSVGKFQICL